MKCKHFFHFFPIHQNETPLPYAIVHQENQNWSTCLNHLKSHSLCSWMRNYTYFCSQILTLMYFTVEQLKNGVNEKMCWVKHTLMAVRVNLTLKTVWPILRQGRKLITILGRPGTNGLFRPVISVICHITVVVCSNRLFWSNLRHYKHRFYLQSISKQYTCRIFKTAHAH